MKFVAAALGLAALAFAHPSEALTYRYLSIPRSGLGPSPHTARDSALLQVSNVCRNLGGSLTAPPSVFVHRSGHLYVANVTGYCRYLSRT